MMSILGNITIKSEGKQNYNQYGTLRARERVL